MSIPSVQELMRTAEMETSLSDWTLDHVGTPEEALDIMVGDLNRHAGLHSKGEARFYRLLIETLIARLKYVADRKRHPQWRDEVINAPIFILGMPRAGTTFLHNLMGSDPESRTLRLFELHCPAPQPSDTFTRELKVKYCQEFLADLGLLDEDWLGVHPMGADRAEECLFFWELLFLSMNFPPRAEMPNYQEFLYRQDFKSIYLEHRDFLRYMQHRGPKGRWILKSPIHVRFLDEILDVFPDASFVHCHRDTAKIYPSVASLAEILHSKFANVRPASRTVIGDYDGSWQNAIKFRQKPGMAGRFVDIHFSDFRADPIGTVAIIYKRLGLSFSTQRAAKMSGWLEADNVERASQKHHQYSLADIGMSEAEIDRLTGDYLRAFDIALER